VTAIAEAPLRRTADPHPVTEPAVVPADPDPRSDVEPEISAPTLRPGRVILAWLVITVLGVWLVLVSVGPVTAARDQRALLTSYREQIESATNEAFGLAGVEVPIEAPSRGDAVGILDIDALGLSQVVVEGTAPTETRQGPGHVVGTGGPGQPGNSVIVGRRNLFGGPFGSIEDLERGDRILVTTDQGQTVYEVAHVGTHTIVTAGSSSPDEPIDDADATPDVTVAVSEERGDDAAGEEALLPDGPVPAELVYGPTADDRLTLVTSDSPLPWSSDDATVVVARLDGVPFAPTPQGGRTAEDDGRGGDPGSTAALLLALLVYSAAVVGTVWLHRNVPWRSAYLLSAPLLLALTIVLAEQVASVLPAWS
jgi:sortase A